MNSSHSCSCPSKQTKRSLVVASQTQLRPSQSAGGSGESFSAQIVSEDKLPDLTGNGSLFDGTSPGRPKVIAVVEIPPQLAHLLDVLTPEAVKELCGLFAETSGKVHAEAAEMATAD